MSLITLLSISIETLVFASSLICKLQFLVQCLLCLLKTFSEPENGQLGVTKSFLFNQPTVQILLKFPLFPPQKSSHRTKPQKSNGLRGSGGGAESSGQGNGDL